MNVIIWFVDCVGDIIFYARNDFLGNTHMWWSSGVRQGTTIPLRRRHGITRDCSVGYGPVGGLLATMNPKLEIV